MAVAEHACILVVELIKDTHDSGCNDALLVLPAMHGEMFSFPNSMSLLRRWGINKSAFFTSSSLAFAQIGMDF